MDEVALRKYYHAWGTGDPEKVAAFFEKMCLFEDVALEMMFTGIDGVIEFAKLTFASIPDFKVQPTRLVTQKNAAAASWIMSGTHSGDLPNLPATGKRFQVRASSIIRTNGNKIIEIMDYWNPIQFQKQVGLL